MINFESATAEQSQLPTNSRFEATHSLSCKAPLSTSHTHTHPFAYPSLVREKKDKKGKVGVGGGEGEQYRGEKEIDDEREKGEEGWAHTREARWG